MTNTKKELSGVLLISPPQDRLGSLRWCDMAHCLCYTDSYRTPRIHGLETDVPKRQVQHNKRTIEAQLSAVGGNNVSGI